LTLEQWPVERLIDYARNPRKNDHAVEQMAAVISGVRVSDAGGGQEHG
jgi:hypothetical protein